MRRVKVPGLDIEIRDGGRGVSAGAFCTSCATSFASKFNVSANCLTTKKSSFTTDFPSPLSPVAEDSGAGPSTGMGDAGVGIDPYGSMGYVM